MGWARLYVLNCFVVCALGNRASLTEISNYIVMYYLTV